MNERLKVFDEKMTKTMTNLDGDNPCGEGEPKRS